MIQARTLSQPAIYEFSETEPITPSPPVRIYPKFAIARLEELVFWLAVLSIPFCLFSRFVGFMTQLVN